jgi:DNA-binding Xre family transcriptional regulator
MEYLAKEDVEILDHFSEEFLKNNEGTLEALLFEQKEYEESIKELQKSIKNNTDVEIEDLNNQEYLLLHYSEKLKEINNKIESHNVDFITFSSQNIENYSEEDLQLILSSIQEINEKKNELLNSVEIIKNELEKLNSNNEYEFINLHNQLENYNQELENLNSQILEYEYQRDQINLQLEDKTRTFFTSDFSNCTKEEATEIIDKQSKGLEKNDSKYFMLSIDPSEKEIKHLLSDIVPDVEAVKSHKDLTSLEQKQLNDKLKDYTHLVMEEYAKEFDRTKKWREIR